MNTPQELKYAKTDEWIKVDGDEAIIGISDYAQDQLSILSTLNLWLKKAMPLRKVAKLPQLNP